VREKRGEYGESQVKDWKDGNIEGTEWEEMWKLVGTKRGEGGKRDKRERNHGGKRLGTRGNLVPQPCRKRWTKLGGKIGISISHFFPTRRAHWNSAL
jgi:hypothetical protein